MKTYQHVKEPDTIFDLIKVGDTITATRPKEVVLGVVKSVTSKYVILSGDTKVKPSEIIKINNREVIILEQKLKP